MEPYRQKMFYGICNPCGNDIIEGQPIEFLHKDGRKICGGLIDAGIEKFVVEDADGIEESFSYDDIQRILQAF